MELNKFVCKPMCSVNDLRRYFMQGRVGAAGLSMLSLAEFIEALNGKTISDCFAVIVVCAGTTKIEVCGRHFELHGNDVFLSDALSCIKSMRCSKACVGYVAIFSRNFLSSIEVDVNDAMAGRAALQQQPCFTLLSEDMERLNRVVVSLLGMDNEVADMYGERVVVSLFTSYFYILASALSRLNRPAGKSLRSEELFARFVALLGEECVRERSVEYYAKSLNITPKYLSLICKAQTSQNASKVIDDAVIRCAKSLLMQPGVSVQEVAERLNFVSQSFFGKYFKQRVGVAPSRYKLQKI